MNEKLANEILSQANMASQLLHFLVVTFFTVIVTSQLIKPVKANED